MAKRKKPDSLAGQVKLKQKKKSNAGCRGKLTVKGKERGTATAYSYTRSTGSAASSSKSDSDSDGPGSSHALIDPIDTATVDVESDSYQMSENDSNEFEEIARGSGTADSLDFEVDLNTGGTADDMEDNSDAEFQDTRNLIMQHNRKKKKSGGFQSMGLSHGVFKGVLRKGYKIPTPIQRKTIPVIMDGKDVVAMARTGSGKTAAFLIPMFERLKTHFTTGARGLVLTPTRELALQTLKFTKELGRFTGLKSAVILGGDKMEDQFEAIHSNPDIIIATPGRFMHVLVEMNLKLNSVEYVVFDEADRLFEMGFQEQLQEILGRLPEARQTLLFSATLPKLLVEFAKAGLHDPTLVRLDVDTKLSEHLKLSFLQCRSEDKTAILLYLLRNIVKPSEQTVVFAATKHHVEYLNMILQEAGIQCSYIYSSLDQTARKINVGKFRNKKTMVLVVTDLAARGIDIPMLDNVINYNFPAKPKLFVHRVGRVARAGRSGTAYSLVGPDELPYVMDLHLFLGRPMKYVVPGKQKQDNDGLFGRVPQSIVDDEEETLRVLKEKADVASMLKVISNAYMQYSRSRPAPSVESVKRVKQMCDVHIGGHPLFGKDEQVEEERTKLLDSMRNYRPPNTIFEINSTKKTQSFEIMKKKRELHGGVIEISSKKKEDTLAKFAGKEDDDDDRPGHQEMSTETDLQEAFSKVVAPKRPASNRDFEPKKKKKKKAGGRDEENYVSYRPKDYQSEKGLSLGTSFENEVAGAVLDFTGDDDQNAKKLKNQLKWDRKRKKFVRDTGGNESKKKIKTESGAWIAATYKSNLYKEWLDKNKVLQQNDDSDGDEQQQQHRERGTKHRGQRGKKERGKPGGRGKGGGGGGKRDFSGKGRKGAGGPSSSSSGGNKFRFGGRTELKRKEQILKGRKIKAKKEAFQNHRAKQQKKKKAMGAKRR